MRVKRPQEAETGAAIAMTWMTQNHLQMKLMFRKQDKNKKEYI